MKVKLEEQAMVFKVSEDEMNTLLEGKDVTAHIGFATKTMRILISPTADAEECGMCPELISMDDMVFVNLIIGQEHLQNLNEMGRNREGVSCQCGNVAVALQVDYRQDSRKAVKEA